MHDAEGHSYQMKKKLRVPRNRIQIDYNEYVE